MIYGGAVRAGHCQTCGWPWRHPCHPLSLGILVIFYNKKIGISHAGGSFCPPASGVLKDLCSEKSGYQALFGVG